MDNHVRSIGVAFECINERRGCA